MSDPARLLPIVYDPPIGEACLKFGHICRQTAGLYLSITRRKVTEILRSWPLKDIRFICILTAAESSALGGPWRKRHGHPHWQAAILYGGSRCAPQYLLPMYLEGPTMSDTCTIRRIVACAGRARQRRSCFPSSTSSSTRRSSRSAVTDGACPVSVNAGLGRAKTCQKPTSPCDP